MICEAIKNVKPDMSVIPTFASLTESAYYIIEANEKDFTEMIKSIGLRELGIFESTGSVLLYEEKDEETAAVAENKENWFVKVWARIKALFEKFLHIINDIHAKLVNVIGKKALKEDKEKLKAGIEKLSDKFAVQTYEYNVLKDQIQYAKPNNGDEVFKPNSSDNDTDKIKSWLRGKPITIAKADLANYIDKIIGAVADYNTTVANIKSLYKEYQIKYNSRIAEAKKVAGDNKEELNKMKMTCNNEILFLSVLLNEYQKMYVTNVNIIIKLASAANKKVEDKKAEAKPEKVEGEVVDNKEEVTGESAQILTEAKWQFFPVFKQRKLDKLKDELTEIELFTKDKYDESTDKEVNKILDICLRVMDVIINIGSIFSTIECITIIWIPVHCLIRTFSWLYKSGQEYLTEDRYKAAVSKLEKIRDQKCETEEDKKKIQDMIDKLAKTKKKADKEGGKSVEESAFDSELSSLFDWTY